MPPNTTPQELLLAVRELAEKCPDCTLERTIVGNLAIVRGDGNQIGYLDLIGAEVVLDAEWNYEASPILPDPQES